MKAKLISDDNYVVVDDQMNFPNPTSEKMADVEWKLTHAQNSLSRADMLYAAAVIGAYRELIYKAESSRNYVCFAIRRAICEAKEGGDG